MTLIIELGFDSGNSNHGGAARATLTGRELCLDQVKRLPGDEIH